MKRPLREAPQTKPLARAISLCLLGACAIFSSAPTAAALSWHVTWRADLRPGESLSAQVELSNMCKGPILYRVSASPLARVNLPGGTITVGPGQRKAIGVSFYAPANVWGKVWSRVSVECLDCRKQLPNCGLLSLSEYVAEITVVNPQAANQRTADLKQFARASQKFEREVRNLKVIEGVEAATGGKVAGYEFEKFEALLDGVRGQLQDAVEGREMAALRQFISRNFPNPREVQKRVIVPSASPSAAASSESFSFTLAPRFDAAREFADRRVIVPLEAATRAFADVNSFILMLASRGPVITLRVITEPDGANITLGAAGGKTYNYRTNSDIPNFTLGDYTLTVTKSGFQTIEQKIEGIGFFETSLIECRLVSKDSGEERPYCNLK